MNTWEISGMLIVKWPFTIKIRTCKQVSKPQTKIVGFPFCGLVFSPLICCFIAKQYRVFDKICKHEFLEKFECTECISSILEQKLECLNRTQTSLNFGFIIQWQHMITLFFYFKTSRTFLFLHFMFLVRASNEVKTWCLILQVVQVIRTNLVSAFTISQKKNWGNFQRKVEGTFTWNSRRISWPPALIENPAI